MTAELTATAFDTRPLTETAAARTGRAPAVALQATAALFASLNQQGIRYCHWKSNLRLAAGLRGETDLDLLVDLRDETAFQQALRDCGIVRAVAPPGKRYPGLADYIGFDPTTGRLFHLHVHYQLVLGEQFVKNYHLPLEATFLRDTHTHLGVRIPTPDLELMVLALRLLLKYRDRDVIKDTLAIRSPGIPAHIAAEVQWLQEQTTPAAVRNRAQELLGDAAADTICETLLTIQSNPRDGRTLWRLRRQARAALRPYQRDSRPVAVARYWREATQRQLLARYVPQKKMTPAQGGLSIAFVGADGSGKTTITTDTETWLRNFWQVQRHYQGSKQPSRRSDWLYLSFRAGRRGHREVVASLGGQHPFSHTLANLRQTFLYGHYLSVGYDRFRRHRIGQRQARNGELVLYDRFPLIAPLDGPEVERAAGADTGRVAQFIAQRERRLYERYELPDVFVILRVDPVVSITRKPDHLAETVREKTLLLDELLAAPDSALNRTGLIVIDANQPLADVLLQTRRALWNVITNRDTTAEPVDAHDH